MRCGLEKPLGDNKPSTRLETLLVIDKLAKNLLGYILSNHVARI